MISPVLQDAHVWKSNGAVSRQLPANTLHCLTKIAWRYKVYIVLIINRKQTKIASVLL
jgi:hypothetical protein